MRVDRGVEGWTVALIITTRDPTPQPILMSTGHYSYLRLLMILLTKNLAYGEVLNKSVHMTYVLIKK